MNSRILVLCDLDGTLYERGVPIAGATEALDRMRSLATVRLLTNTDSLPTKDIQRRLVAMGLGQIAVEDIFTPVVAAKVRMAAMSSAVFLTTSEVRDEIGPHLRDVTAARDSSSADAVVVGDIRHALNYELMDRAFAELRHGAQLLALQRGRYFRAEGGDHLDTGAFVAALEFAAQVPSELLGKPSTNFVDLAIQSAGGAGQFDRIVVIGDDRTTDIAMAHDAGLHSIQVMTGKAIGQRDRTDLPRPDFTADTIVSALDLLVDER